MRHFLLALALLAIPACQAWHVDNRPVEAVVQAQQGAATAYTMNDLRWVVLKNATLANDSIIGTRIGGNTYSRRSRTALSVTGVRSVERRRISVLRTIGLGVVAAFIPTLYRLAVVEED
jgi:hypothetical protein